MTAASVPPDVPLSEFRERQQRAIDAARDRGLSGLLVWSRMGTDMYRFGDVAYLSNHHGPVGDFQDAGGWLGHGYNVLVLPVDGEPILIVDLPVPDQDRICAAEIRFATRIPDAVAVALRDSGMAGRPVGLVGRQTLLASSRDALQEQLAGRLELREADDIVETMRTVKSEAELALIRNAVAVGCESVTRMMNAIQPG